MILLEKTTDPKTVTVIGCGRWGTFLAWYLDAIGHRVSLYGRAGSARFAALRDTRRNEYVALPERVRLTSDESELPGARLLVISVNTQGLAALAAQLAALGVHGATIVLCMKGVEIETGRRLSQIVGDTLDASNRAAVWLGPGHVQEFTRGIPNCMVIDSASDEAKREVIAAFSSQLIRFYYGNDLIGNEIGAAAKNVVGIAAGMLDGLQLSTLKGALMARGSREVARLIGAMGGNEMSAYGLCHLGDYEATVFSAFSHNRRYGESVVLGEPFHRLAEGYHTCRALRALGKRHGVELPINEAVYRVLYENCPPREALDALFARSIKEEFA